MGEVTRLPVQHRKKPHCPSCDAALPAFDGVSLLLVPECELLSIIFKIRCSCGSVWNLEKTVAGSPSAP